MKYLQKVYYIATVFSEIKFEGQCTDLYARVRLHCLQVNQNNHPVCEHLLGLSVPDNKRTMTRAEKNIIMCHRGGDTHYGGGLEAGFCFWKVVDLLVFIAWRS